MPEDVELGAEALGGGALPDGRDQLAGGETSHSTAATGGVPTSPADPVCRWQYSTRGGWQDFSADVSHIVEAAYKEKSAKVRYDIGGTAFMLDFGVLRQVCIDDPKRVRDVRRLDPDESDGQCSKDTGVAPTRLGTTRILQEGPISAVTLAAHLVESLRIEAGGLRHDASRPHLCHVVNFDIAVAFIGRMGQLRAQRGAALAAPRIVYHWTTGANAQFIEKTNLQVPGKSTGVSNRTDAGYYGCGIYTAPKFKCKANEIFAKKRATCLLCLSLPGKMYHARFFVDNGLTLVKGYDSHISADSVDGLPGDQLIFFCPDQLLPCFQVTDKTWEAAQALAARAAETLQAYVTQVPPEEHAPPVATLARTRRRCACGTARCHTYRLCRGRISCRCLYCFVAPVAIFAFAAVIGAACIVVLALVLSRQLKA
mmetsp:Transcript_87483/g.245628  ORF Transcript_87483/g.245628 Transcript_87483/m.245628 type:complete len:426 (-) Transcript_87483:82-1359(-)